MGLPVKFEAVQRVDPANPLANLSLPAWLNASLNGLTASSIEVTREDGVKARMVVPAVQRSLSPSTSMRAAIAKRAGELAAALVAFDTDMLAANVSDMLLGFIVQGLGDSGHEGRARSYMMALDDLPAWAVGDACRRWLRHEAGEYNYAFPPTPPILRDLAMTARLRVEGQLRSLNKLLEAHVVEDPPTYTDEHRAEMQEKLQTLFAGIANKKAVP